MRAGGISVTMPSTANTLEISDEGNLRISGLIPKPPENGDDAAAWLKLCILSLNGLQATYDRLLSDDGFLVGQERFELTSAIDETLNHFVKLRALLSRKQRYTAVNLRYDYRMLVTFEQNRWRGQGRLGRYRNIKISEFQLWLARTRKQRLPQLIQFLGKALADGKIDEREQIILDRAIDRLLFSFILVRVNVQTGRLS